MYFFLFSALEEYTFTNKGPNSHAHFNGEIDTLTEFSNKPPITINQLKKFYDPIDGSSTSSIHTLYGTDFETFHAKMYYFFYRHMYVML